jgi:predicted DNA-binding WGR domain protein
VTLLDVFKLTLEARNPERNCFRFWEIRVGPDLLDDWVGTTQWGRIGTEGQIKRFIASDRKESQIEVRRQIRRRTFSPKRIGVGYKRTYLYDPEEWLTGENIINNFIFKYRVFSNSEKKKARN